MGMQRRALQQSAWSPAFAWGQSACAWLHPQTLVVHYLPRTATVMLMQAGHASWMQGCGFDTTSG